jgi:hypothetical protein
MKKKYIIILWVNKFIKKNNINRIKVPQLVPLEREGVNMNRG